MKFDTRVLLKYVGTLQLWFRLNDNNGHFIESPTCVSACGSDWVMNSKSSLVTMETVVPA
jgi:hypothetical protein